MKKKLILILLWLISIVSYSQNILSTTIEFKVNTSEIIEYNNYQEIISEVQSRKVESVLIVGAASPEGNEKKNRLLAEERANVILSSIRCFVPEQKILKTTDYTLFLEKTRLDESEYQKLRATYIEVHFLEPTIAQKDTVYVFSETHHYDTLYVLSQEPNKKLLFSVYNDLVSDFSSVGHVGLELYSRNTSIFIEKYFNSFWYAGIRQYFDQSFIELHLKTKKDVNALGLGYGYKFKIAKTWNLYPILRLGINRTSSTNKDGEITFGEYLPEWAIQQETPKEELNVKTTINYKPYIYIGIQIQKDFYLWKK